MATLTRPVQRLSVNHLLWTVGYELVAEGAESEALLQRVTALGFSHAQGFHVGRQAALPETCSGTRRVAGQGQTTICGTRSDC